MEKLKNIIKAYIMYGMLPKDTSYSDMRTLVDIYNELVDGKNPEFIQFNVKKVLDTCGILTAPKGIGWIVYNIWRKK